MNFAVKKNRYYGEYKCTCGNVFYRENKCPNCEGKTLIQYRNFKNYTRYTSNEILEKTNERLLMQNIVADLTSIAKMKTPVNFSIYDILVDYRNHNVSLKLNGVEIPVNQANCRKAMTGFEAYKLSGLLYLIARKFIDNENCGDAVLYYFEHPELEILYSTYKTIDMAVGCNLKKGTKPHEIMGFSKTTMKCYIDLEKQTGQSFANINRHIDAIYKIDKFYEGKPDKIKMVFDFVASIRGLDFEGIYKLLSGHNYDLIKLRQYLTDEIYTYQGIESPYEGFRILTDYVTICDRMNAPIEKYPKSLKLAHDIANKNLKIVISEIEAKEFENVVLSKEYKLLAYKGKKYQVVTPKNAEDVINEGRKLHHCVGSYVNRIRKNETKICFMREIDSIDTPLITLEVRDGYLTQYRGNCNRCPSNGEMEFIKEYAKSKDIKIM